jgi:hypothetical protein
MFRGYSTSVNDRCFGLMGYEFYTVRLCWSQETLKLYGPGKTRNPKP